MEPVATEALKVFSDPWKVNEYVPLLWKQNEQNGCIINKIITTKKSLPQSILLDFFYLSDRAQTVCMIPRRELVALMRY